MRGKRFDLIKRIFVFRITPADAGKTATACLGVIAEWDHPRGCGENVAKRANCSLEVGSPPRMRGKPMLSKQDLDAARITPADAGKTPTPERRVIKCKDHPRGCGENLSPRIALIGQLGSPPRMRGKLVNRFLRAETTGITPADAGKTLFVLVVDNIV